MKKLASAKTRTILETADTVRDGGSYRQVIVEAHAEYAVLRCKGLRRSYPISWAGLYCFALKVQMQREADERKAAKKARRK